MEMLNWHLLFVLFVLQLNFFLNVAEDVDEIYEIDLSRRGRTRISAFPNIGNILKKCHLAPGKSVELDFTPPEGVRTEYGETIFGNILKLVPGFLEAPDTTYTLVSSENSDKFVDDFSVVINGGFMGDVGMQMPLAPNLLGPFVGEIPSFRTDINSHLRGILKRVFSQNHKSICGEKYGFTIQLRPPEGSRMDYEDILFQSLKAQLEASTPCKLKYSINRKIVQHVDKTLIKMEYIINVIRSTLEDVWNFNIDLTQVGVDYSKILNRLCAKYIWTASKNSCRVMNIIVKLSPDTSRQSTENLVEMTRSIIFGAKPRPQFRIDPPSPRNNDLNIQLGCGAIQIPNVLDGTLIIDLSLPGISEASTIESSLTNTLPKIRAELNMKNFATISFTIKPPPNQGQSYVANAEEVLKIILKKFFGDCEIAVHYQSTINPQGFVTDIRYEVSLKRLVNRENFSSRGDQVVVSRDFTKFGINNIFEIRAMMLELLPKIKTDLQSNNEISFTMSIKIPKRTTLDYLKTLQNLLTVQLRAYFPHYIIQMTPKSDPTEVVFDVRLVPALGENGSVFIPQTTKRILLIDLQNPAVDLTNELNNLILKLLPQSLKVLDRHIPFSFSVMLIPPWRTILQFVDGVTEAMKEVINHHLPNYYPVINVHSKINFLGYLVNTIFEVQIHPKRKNKPSSIIQDWKTTSVDLAKPMQSLVSEIKILLQNLLPGFTSKLNRGLSVGLRFEMKPVPNIKKEHLKIISAMIIPIVINTFPNHRVDTRQIDVQDDEANIKHGAIEIIIHPKNRNDELKIFRYPLFSLNLFHSSSSLDSEMMKTLPKMFKHIGDISNTAKLHTFEFFITPPPNSRENYVHGISHVILDYIVKYFPDYSTVFFTNGLEDFNENIKSIILKVTLVPGNSPVERGILTGEPPNTFEIKVASNTNDFIYSIGEWMQSNILRILVELEKHPVVLKIHVKPHKQVKKYYEVPMLEEVKELMLNLFPHWNIRFGVSGIKDWKAFVTHMVFEVFIERNPKKKSPEINSEVTYPPQVSTTTDNPPSPNPWITDRYPENFQEIHKPPSSKTPKFTTEMAPWETTTKPPFFSPPMTTIPPIYLYPKLEDDLEVLVLPKLSENMIDIISILKSGYPGEVPYIFNFPKGTNRQHIEGMKQILINIFESYFPDYLIHSTLNVKGSYGSSITSVEIKMSISPPKQEVITIATTQGLRIPFSSIQKTIIDNLIQDKKVRIMLNVKKTKQQSPKFVLDIIRTLNVILEELYSGLEFHFDVDTNDEDIISVLITLKSPVSQNPSGNNPTNLIITVHESGKSPTQRLDDTLNSIYSTLKPVVDEGRKLVLILNMNLNKNKMPVENIFDHLRSVLKQMIPNAAISITPYVRRGPNNMISYIRFLITLELYTVNETEQVESLTIDLSNPQLTISSEIEKMLPNIIAVIQRYSNQQGSIILNLQILPPSRSTDLFLQTVIGILAPLLASPFCNYGMNLKASTSRDLEGFLKDVVLSVILQPSGISPGTMQCQRKIDIDLTRPGTRLDEEIDERLQKTYIELQSILSQGKSQVLHFKILPPPRKNSDYMNYLSNSSIAIIQNYFPYNNVSIRIHAEQTPERYLSTALVTITIQPETNPLPKSQINIPIDISLGGSLSLYVKTSIHPYMSQIQALLVENPPAVISFSISPRRGVKDTYLQEITSELADLMHELFGTGIHVQSKAAKNSRNELFKILMVVTITPNN